jgi:ubiquitin-protein ligase
MTRTWHPNVIEQDTVCLRILKDTHPPVMSINHLIAALLFLFPDPCVFSPLSPMAGQRYKHRTDEFQTEVNEYIRLYCPK